MFKKFFHWIKAWLWPAKKAPSYSLRFAEGDELPDNIRPYELVIAREDETLWSAGMLCPCGCGKTLELMLLPDVKPRWDFSFDSQGKPTLYPSVWLTKDCRSHFWLRGGEILWCSELEESTQPVPKD